jgi:hypothetical protein
VAARNRLKFIALIQAFSLYIQVAKNTTMPKGYAPTVFVSSTCYDLKQLRADLSVFLSDLGLEPFLSESITFSIDPQSSNIDNCVNAVNERADIFILVIGNRYGTLDDSGKSITNLEFLAAKSKGREVKRNTNLHFCAQNGDCWPGFLESQSQCGFQRLY